MRKLIEITNGPNFKEGVASYVRHCSPETNSYEIRPNSSNAKNYTGDMKITQHLEYIKNQLPEAIVKIIEVE